MLLWHFLALWQTFCRLNRSSANLFHLIVVNLQLNVPNRTGTAGLNWMLTYCSVSPHDVQPTSWFSGVNFLSCFAKCLCLASALKLEQRETAGVWKCWLQTASFSLKDEINFLLFLYPEETVEHNLVDTDPSKYSLIGPDTDRLRASQF